MTVQLKVELITVKTGTLVDATITAPSNEGYGDARRVKPRKIATLAIANKTARIAWAVMRRQEEYSAA
jgi:hypothetical protein